MSIRIQTHLRAEIFISTDTEISQFQLGFSTVDGFDIVPSIVEGGLADAIGMLTGIEFGTVFGIATASGTIQPGEQGSGERKRAESHWACHRRRLIDILLLGHSRLLRASH